jgi:AraC-like DNA-binding protein
MNWSDKIIPFQLHPLGFIESFHRYGADVDELLARSAISRTLLDASDSRISYRQLVDLVRTGIQLCKRPGIGLLVGRNFDWCYYGLPGMAILSSTSFKKATYILHRYTCLVQPYYAPYKSKPAYFVDNHRKVIIPVQYLISTDLGDANLYRFELEFRVGLLLQLLHHFGSAAHHPSSVQVQLAMPRPSHVHLYKELAGYDFQFSCETSRFIVPAAMLKSPLDRMRTGVCEHVLRYCSEELDRIEQSTSCVERVKALFYENIPHYLNQKAVAEKLGITTRTLARRLHEENTRFRDVLNEVRREVATYLLGTTQLSVADIAESVGFSDTTNFRQAFKRWTGHSASDVRGRRPRASVKATAPAKAGSARISASTGDVNVRRSLSRSA